MRLRVGRVRVGVAAGLQMSQDSGGAQAGRLRDVSLLRADVGGLGQLSLREERPGHLPGQELNNLECHMLTNQSLKNI